MNIFRSTTPTAAAVIGKNGERFPRLRYRLTQCAARRHHPIVYYLL